MSPRSPHRGHSRKNFPGCFGTQSAPRSGMIKAKGCGHLFPTKTQSVGHIVIQQTSTGDFKPGSNGIVER